MVFEGVLVQVLNSILGDYVENLDTKQLSVGIWGGDVLLKDLQLKQSALNNLDLPIQTIYGKIGKLVLKIPWKNLYGAAFVINVEDVYLIAAPNTQTAYDEEKERKKSLEAKKVQIKNVELAKKMEQEKEKVQKVDFTFVEKLIAQIIKNLQLNIKNIHIRYEDKITNPESPFALGVTLGELNVISTDENWEPKITQENITKIFKIVALDSLAIYWNCKTRPHSDMSIVTLVDNMTKGIATSNVTPTGYSYILGPINASARLRINQKPEQDTPAYTIPKIHLNLDLKKLYVGLSKAQYKDIILMMNTMDQMIKADPFRKYRPALPSYRGHYKLWWSFAYQCVLESEVRRKRRNWDWNHISNHRNMCKMYQQKYYDKLISNTVNVTDPELDELEEKLDIFNIVLIRQRVELEAERIRKLEASKPKQGWFGWMWGSQQQGSSDSDTQEILDENLSAEEKEKLYKAIDYHEGAPVPTYPESYVDITATFLLRTLELEIKDELLDNESVLLTELKGVKCRYDSRSSAQALKVHVKIDEFVTCGIQQDGDRPHVITSKTDDRDDGVLLEATFEINPIDQKCDQRLVLLVEPIKIIYDAATINSITSIFQVESSNLEQLQAAAAEKMESFKEKSAIGLQHAIEQHTLLDLKINLQAPIILLPYGGKYSPYVNMIIVNLGKFKIETVDRPQSGLNVRKMYAEGKAQTEILQEMIEQCYDQFKIEFTDLQILLSQGDEDWRACLRESKKSNMHILVPISLKLMFYKCLITNDVRLPISKIVAELPSIDVSISNVKILLLYNLVNSIPLPESEETEIPLKLERSTSDRSLLKALVAPPKAIKTKKTPKEEHVDDISWQLTNLEAQFLMKKFTLTIGHQDDSASPVIEVATLSTENLHCELKQKKYSVSVAARLSSIELNQYRSEGEKIDIISIPNSTKEDLISLRFLQVDEKAPDFKSTYGLCKMKLDADISVINIDLHQEGLLSLISFQTKLQNDLIESVEEESEFFKASVSQLKRSVSVISGLSHVSQNLPKSKATTDQKPNSDAAEITNLHLAVKLKELKLLITTEKLKISDIAINGITAEVEMKDSCMIVNSKLEKLAVLDLNPKTIHKQILTVVGQQTLSAKIVIYNNTEKKTFSDVDMSVEAQMGGLKIFFLNWFVTNVLNFLNNFQAAKQVIVEASANAAEAAKQSAQEAYEKASKISLNIKLKAPDIIIPVNSTSLDGIILDLGYITVSNKFENLEIGGEKKDQQHAVIDRLRVTLSRFKLSNVKLDSANNVIEERLILKPITSKLSINRNLCASWYHKVPDVDISGKINEIKIRFSQMDMTAIMNTLNGNLAEGVNAPQEKAALEAAPISTLKDNVSTVVVSEVKIEQPETSAEPADSQVSKTVLRFTITMDMLEINLLAIRKDQPDYHLGRFSLEGLSCKGRILLDGTVSTSILLLDIVLDDMRPDRNQAIQRLIERRNDDTDDSKVVSSMLDVTFQQKGDEMFVDIRVYSFIFIVSIEYMMKLADFFKTTANNEALATSELMKQTTTMKSLANKSVASSVPTQSTSKMTINLKIENPDIILVEQMDNLDTSAIILNNQIQVKYRSQGPHQVVSGTIKDFQLVSCNYNPSKRKDTMSHIISPITISLAGSTPPNKGLQLELLFTELRFSLTPSTIGLLSNISSKFGSTDSTTSLQYDPFQFLDLWHQKPFKDEDYWYLRTDSGIDAMDLIDSQRSNASMTINEVLEELCIVHIPSITLTLETGEGQKTLPMLLLESKFQGNVRNWSSQLNIDASLSLMMGYYNSYLALWEPLIEPVQTKKNGKISFAPWELTLEMALHTPEDQSILSPNDSDVGSVQLQPLTSIDLSSKTTLEVTMTKTSLQVLTALGRSFSSAMEKRDFVPDNKLSSHKFINEIGTTVTLLLDKGPFRVSGMEYGIEPNEVVLETGAEIHLELRQSEEDRVRLGEVLITQSYSVKSKFLNVKVNEINCTLELPVTRADKRYFMLKYRGVNNQAYGVISDCQELDGVMTITLRSILQVHNHFNMPIELYVLTEKGNEIKRMAIVQPGRHVNLPLSAVYTQTEELFFSVEGYTITSIPFVWKELQSNLIVCKTLQCRPKDTSRGTEPFTLRVIGKMKQVFYEDTLRHTMTSNCYNVHLRPSLSVKNYLPIPIVCCSENVAEEVTVAPGDNLQLPNCSPGQSVLVIRLENYLEKVWSCRQEVPEEGDEFAVWTFSSYDSSVKVILNLGVHRKTRYQTLELELYCPFWMLNKTGQLLSYKSSEEALSVVHHPPNYNGPILFSFSAKNFFSKKKAAVKIRDGFWSDKFSLDVAGSSGMINCKTDDQVYQVGVTNQLTNNGLTKQITFTPYYVIINNTSFAMEFQESIRPADHWLKCEPESCAALWPISEYDDKLLRLRISGTEDLSQAFLYTESHTTLLRLDNKYGGINVDIQITEGGVYVSLVAYGVGMAPALIVNHTRDEMNFWEKQSAKISKLKKGHSMLYTWENPSGPRVLVWEGGTKMEMENDLRKDEIGEYTVGTKNSGYKIYWVSFLDGMQRVLLFTEDSYIAENVESSKRFEIVDQEFTVSLFGLGLSLIDNISKKDIMYMGVTSSGIIWEACKFSSNRFKHLSQKESVTIEAAYQDYLLNPIKNSGIVNVGGKMEIDFGLEQMYKPNRRKLRRSFQTAIWFQKKTSASQLQLHAKINSLQIDNQLPNCLFPVVLATVQPPKSVALNSGVKPFAEVSVVEMFIKNSQVKQFKYFKVLIQEFHVKVEMGFINAMLNVVAAEKYTEKEEKEYFEEDMKMANRELYAYVSTHAQQEQKSFYDLLHFSPLKIHVSFSLGAGAADTTETSNFLHVILNSVGVTVTDMQDVIFKLAFFERDYTFLTTKQLINEATKHYVGQLLKQVYVLVLGLDVLGNPYGLVLGITKGVEDLFYEPFQGAIQGPGEFAEGLALGVRSLFGHTVGGAAGAVSRITGAMGKGVAALTFDDEYQRKRRDLISKKPTTIQEGFARGGKGLVMGVVSGVTGVVTKPISGAKAEGVGGFFKGLGKGAVGLIARPTSGVIDFASGSLDAVKRVADVGEETTRLRSPRFIQVDGLVKPYNKHEAEGYKLLMDLDKGKYATTDVYVYHYQVEKKEILLLTDQRLAYVVLNDIFGGWQVDWSYTWQELTHPARVVPKGITITTGEKKKFFGSSDTGKTVLIGDSFTKEIICRKIESLRGNVN